MKNINLSNMTSAQGASLTGQDSSDSFIYTDTQLNNRISVSIAGDVNGDGYDDVIIGAAGFLSQRGQSYVVFGKAGGLSSINLANITSAQGFTITGNDFNDESGFTVSGAGDVNADGVDDIIIGAPEANRHLGQSYVIYGKTEGLNNINLYFPGLTSAQGFNITTSSTNWYDKAGYIVSRTGDINNDGTSDIIVCSPDSGTSYVIYGRSGGPGSIDLKLLSNTQGFSINGIYNSIVLGGNNVYSASSAGDVNGDGIDDIIFGGGSIVNDQTIACVIYGKSGLLSNINVATLTASQGFTISRACVSGADYDGYSVSGVGDVNGDRIDDIVIGVPRMNSYAGMGYVIYGKFGGLSNINLDNFTAEHGFTISGFLANSLGGYSVSRAGDVNGDSLNDIVIAAPKGAYYRGGEGYVIYGKPGRTDNIDIANLTSAQGFIFSDFSFSSYAPKGFTVSGGGDVNGDGFDDIIVGTYSANASLQKIATYIIYGFGTNETNSRCTLTGATIDSLNHYEMSLLSLKVYDDPKDSNIALPPGWQPVVNSSAPGIINGPANGYFGRLYVKGDVGVIAHRGTEFKIDNLDNLKATWEDLKSDFDLLMDGVSPQFAAAETFFNYVKSYICSNATDVKYLAFTGHSLGASLAELSGAKFKFPSITFDSPGTREILATNATDFPADAISYSDNNVITYNAAPNIVNTMAEHVGIIHRVYPSVDSMLPYYEYYSFYFWSYSLNGQHQIDGIVNQFNPNTGQPKVIGEQSPWPFGTITGYNGFDHYISYETNPYYWSSFFRSLINKDDLITWLTSNLAELVYGWSSTYSAVGVNITGDDSGNKIWGSTNFDDIIQAGRQNDTHYMHKGNDVSIDSGGYDTYIVPIRFQGNKIIDDTGGLGVIRIDTIDLVGNVYPVLSSLCPTVPNGTTYFKNTGKTGVYYFVRQGNDLLITPDCAYNIQSLANSLTIKNFEWGRLGLTEYTGGDKAVLVGSNDDNYLDCSIYKRLFSTCLASSLEGEDILVVEVGQNAVLIGSDLGKKVFKLLKSNDGASSHNRLLLQHTEKTLNINGIKDGDILDLSDVLTDQNSITIRQNGTNMQVDLGNKGIMNAAITSGNPYVWFNLTNGNITVSNMNMTKVLEDNGIIIVNGTIVGNRTDSPSAPHHEPEYLKNVVMPISIVIGALTAGYFVIKYVHKHCYAETRFVPLEMSTIRTFSAKEPTTLPEEIKNICSDVLDNNKFSLPEAEGNVIANLMHHTCNKSVLNIEQLYQDLLAASKINYLILTFASQALATSHHNTIIVFDKDITSAYYPEDDIVGVRASTGTESAYANPKAILMHELTHLVSSNIDSNATQENSIYQSTLELMLRYAASLQDIELKDGSNIYEMMHTISNNTALGLTKEHELDSEEIYFIDRTLDLIEGVINNGRYQEWPEEIVARCVEMQAAGISDEILATCQPIYDLFLSGALLN